MNWFAREDLARMIDWRSTWNRQSPEELRADAEALCADVPGPKVTIELPTAVVSTAISYALQMARRTPEDAGYCQWPVSHAGEWGDGTCGRTGHGSRLPVCRQHASILVEAARERFDDHGEHIDPYTATRFMESINRIQPGGLDQLVLNKIDEYSAPADVYGSRLSAEIANALDNVIESRLESVWCA